MNEQTCNTAQIGARVGRLEFWLDKHPGQRPPDWLIPDWLKATYQASDEQPQPLEVKQRGLFEAVR